MLNLIDLRAGYGRRHILNGINLKINRGEIVALIGPNGSGKSTIVKGIFGLADVYSGEIIFNGQSIINRPTHELARLGIGFVPQGRQIFPNMTVEENLNMGAYIVADQKLVRQKIDWVFRLFPSMAAKRNHSAGNLSGGYQQLLAIARALMQDPHLLLLDEPSLGLSPMVTKEVFKKVVDIRNDGIAILIVEQNVDSAVNIADRIYVLKNGKVLVHRDRRREKALVLGIHRGSATNIKGYVASRAELSGWADPCEQSCD